MALATVEVAAGTVVGMDETLNVPLSDVTVRGRAAFRLSMSAVGVKDKIIDSKEKWDTMSEVVLMMPMIGRGGGRQAEHNVVHDGLIFDGIEAAKDNTCRSSTPIRARRVARGDKNTSKQKFVEVFKTIQPIEDGAELEAEWEGGSSHMGPGHGGGRQAEHDVIHDGLIFDGIEAAKDNTHRSSYACMLVIRVRRVARGDKNTCKRKFAGVFKTIQPIEDGAELEAEWEGCSRLRSTWKRGLDERSHLDDADDHVPVVIWVQWTYVGLKRRMSVEDVVVADKQNTMSSKMDLRWYRGRGRQHM
ncbi:hypothetical protein EDB84DRAFT_1445516 [Lactarius hengduanensis]|nr:hypothetical protein EDB84DRAFT_1445516 [Lactarius hengduanensis]